MVIKAERKIVPLGEIRKVLHQFRRKLVHEEVPVAQMILFGSYARGSAHRDSDIDVAVIIPSGVSRGLRKKTRLFGWWAKQVHIKLEPHVMSTNDFRNPFSSLAGEIRQSGRTVAE